MLLFPPLRASPLEQGRHLARFHPLDTRQHRVTPFPCRAALVRQLIFDVSVHLELKTYDGHG